MADKMEFPKTMREFIDNHSFKDIEEVYTNGAELVPVFRVEQALEHYENEIRNKAIDDFAKWLVEHKIVDEDSMPEIIIDFNEEQLKAGEQND